DTDFSPLRKAARPKLIGSPCRSATYTPSATLPNVPEAGELSRTAKYAQLIAIATGAMFASASRLSGASRCTVEYRARLTPASRGLFDGKGAVVLLAAGLELALPTTTSENPWFDASRLSWRSPTRPSVLFKSSGITMDV